MPRPSAYSRTRRIVMQATMAGILIVLVGAAALLARVREQRWAVTLMPKPHLTPRLAIRVPQGWRVDESMTGPLTVTASQTWRGQEGVRVLEVVQISVVAGVDARGLLGEYLERRAGIAGAGKPFEVLGEPGVLAPFEAYVRDPMAPEIVTGTRPEWYAAAVLPDKAGSGRGLGVILHLGGDAAGGPSGPRVLRQIADGLAVRGVGVPPGGPE